jgi:hypothetical protein
MRGEPLDRVMAGRDERAIDAEFAGDLEVMQRVADEQNGVGRDTKAADEIAAERDLAVRVDIIEAGDVLEESREAEVGDDLVKRLVTISRENGLAQAGGLHGAEDGTAVRVERGIEAAGFVAG